MPRRDDWPEQASLATGFASTGVRGYPAAPVLPDLLPQPIVIPRIHLPCLGERLHPDALPASVAPLPLDESSAHHLLRVLRRQAGDEVEVFDGQGLACRAEIASTRPATVRLLARLPAEPPPRLELVLAQCLSSAEKMDWTIEKAVELGVSRIVPLLSARSVVRLDASRAQKRLQHWQRLVVAASMQCGRNRLPEVSAAQPLRAWLDGLPAARAHEHRWVLSPDARQSLVDLARAAATPLPTAHGQPAGSPPPEGHGALGDAVVGTVIDSKGPGTADGMQAASPCAIDPAPQATTQPERQVWLLCGPEAGLAPEELALAEARGWTPALLGPRVLRTETAGLVGLSVLQAILGDLGTA